MNKYLLSLAISLVSINISVAKTQCLSIAVPEFNLTSDVNCTVSSAKLMSSRLPDQVFLYSLGLSAEETCFTIIDPVTGEEEVPGIISNPETGEEIAITFSGVTGLTLNAYPAPTTPLSFTAASLLKIKVDGKPLGLIATRDAGTIVDFFDPVQASATARLTIAAGTGKFRRVSGYIDEIGKEFNSLDPAYATGVLCGKKLAKSLFGKAE